MWGSVTFPALGCLGLRVMAVQLVHVGFSVVLIENFTKRAETRIKHKESTLNPKPETLKWLRSIRSSRKAAEGGG